jgi:hypothetical protein
LIVLDINGTFVFGGVGDGSFSVVEFWPVQLQICVLGWNQRGSEPGDEYLPKIKRNMITVMNQLKNKVSNNSHEPTQEYTK